MHPIIGARRLDQLLDNLAAIDCTLPPEALRRLDDSSDFVAGFPTDFINETSPWVFGEASARVDPALRHPAALNKLAYSLGVTPSRG